MNVIDTAADKGEVEEVTKSDAMAQMIAVSMNQGFAEKGMQARAKFIGLGLVELDEEEKFELEQFKVSIEPVGGLWGESENRLRLGQACQEKEILVFLKNIRVNQKKEGVGTKVIQTLEEAVLKQGLDTVVVTNLYDKETHEWWGRRGYSDFIERRDSNALPYALIKTLG